MPLSTLVSFSFISLLFYFISLFPFSLFKSICFFPLVLFLPLLIFLSTIMLALVSCLQYIQDTALQLAILAKALF